MSYIDTLSEKQRGNIDLIIDTFISNGITNDFALAGVLAVISKESTFLPLEENLNYTTASNINKTFGVPLSEASKYVSNPVALANRVYANRFENGNESSGDGYRYRGRGFNQITFKGTYKSIGDKMGVDLVSKPELLKDPKIAGEATFVYFESAFNNPSAKSKLKSLYNSTGMNDFKTLNDGLMAYYHANAGWGKTESQIQADVTGGLKKAKERVGDLYKYVKEYVPRKKKNKLVGGLLVTGLILTGMFIYVLIANKRKIK